MARFDERVALITGGASGIGKATAKRIATEGGAVVIADLQDEAGKAVAEEIERDGGKATYVHLDVTDEQGWTDAIAATLDAFGHLDILVNNAGIGDTDPLEVTTLDTWNKVVEVTQTSVFLGLKAAAEALKASGTDLSSTSVRCMASSAPGSAPPTTPRRARYDSSPRRPHSPGPRKASESTRYTRATSTPRSSVTPTATC
jgi:NAD(P)-dependent dehydrogenase (short-subunit alcohol dehydrogenase family)